MQLTCFVSHAIMYLFFSGAFFLKKLFGVHLGTSDYGRLAIDHSVMLLRQFRSLYSMLSVTLNFYKTR